MTASQIPHAEPVQLLLPMSPQHPLPRHLSPVKQVMSLGRYFGPGFSQVKMGAGESQRDLLGRERSQGLGWKERLQEAERYLSFSPISARLPLRQSRRKERQLGMLISHELNYLQDRARAPVGPRGPGPGLKSEER